jgi:hypothetical protein
MLINILICYSQEYRYFTYVPTKFVYFLPNGERIGCANDQQMYCQVANPNDSAAYKRLIIKEGYVKKIDIKKGIYRITVKIDSLTINTNFYDTTDNVFYNNCFLDSFYVEIFTIKEEKVKGQKKIKEGQSYLFTIMPYFVYDCSFGCSNMIREVFISGIPLALATYRINVYTSPNLKGLYYIDTISQDVKQWSNIKKASRRIYWKYCRKYKLKPEEYQKYWYNYDY